MKFRNKTSFWKQLLFDVVCISTNKVSWLSIGSVLTVTFLCLSSIAIAGEKTDPGDALRTIIEAIGSAGYTYSGRGSALVVNNENGAKREQILDFRFKDIMSRSDAYALVNGEKGSFEVDWSVNRENYVGYNGYNAVVQSKPSRQFYREIGYDFHPETFHRIRHLPVEKVLENILNAPGPLHLSLDDKGILHIYAEVDYDDDSASESPAISLDTKNEYKLLSWEHKTRNLNGPGSSSEARYKAEWQKTGSQWYIKKVHFEENLTSVLLHGEPAKPRTSTSSVDITVNDFVPNLDIQDSEFTLAGLNIPQGTIVVDDIVGINYKYGSGIKGTQELEGPLREAEFVKSIKRNADTKNIKEDAIAVDEQTSSDKKSSISNEESTQKKGLPILGQPTYRNVMMIGSLFVGIIVVLGIATKLLLIRKKK